MRLVSGVWCLVVAGGLGGCSRDGYPTEDVVASLRVYGGLNDRAFVEMSFIASLSDGRWTRTEVLGENDHIYASWSGATRELHWESAFYNSSNYGAVFVDVPVGTEFTVEVRRDEHEDAPRSVASVPPPFALEEPPTSVSRSTGLTLQWSGSSDRPTDVMKWTATAADATCMEGIYNREAPDTGSLMVPGTEFASATDGCGVVFTLARSRPGEIDPAFAERSASHGLHELSLVLETGP